MKTIARLLSFCLALLFSVTTLMPSAAMASPSLNREQQMLILALVPYAVANRTETDLGEDFDVYLKGKIEEVFEGEDSDIPDYIGDWDLVWGPVVYQYDPKELGSQEVPTSS